MSEKYIGITMEGVPIKYPENGRFVELHDESEVYSVQVLESIAKYVQLPEHILTLRAHRADEGTFAIMAERAGFVELKCSDYCTTEKEDILKEFEYGDPNELIQDLYSGKATDTQPLKAFYKKAFDELEMHMGERFKMSIDAIRDMTDTFIDAGSKQVGYLHLHMKAFASESGIEEIAENIKNYKPAKSVKASVEKVFGYYAVLKKRER